MTQRDLLGSNGLRSARAVLTGMDDVEFVDLGLDDIVRHSLVTRIVDAYGRSERQDALRRDRSRAGE